MRFVRLSGSESLVRRVLWPVGGGLRCGRLSCCVDRSSAARTLAASRSATTAAACFGLLLLSGAMGRRHFYDLEQVITGEAICTGTGVWNEMAISLILGEDSISISLHYWKHFIRLLEAFHSFTGPFHCLTGPFHSFTGPFQSFIGPFHFLVGHFIALLAHFIPLLDHFIHSLGHFIPLVGHFIPLLGHFIS